jgi:hypothetical protein
MRFETITLACLATACPAFAQSVCSPADVFVQASTVPLGGTPERVVAADTNGDGISDLIVLDGDPATVSVGVLLGAGNGTFGPLLTPAGAPFADGNLLLDLAVGDLNNDGRDDVALTRVTASTTDGNLLVFLANTDGTLMPPLFPSSVRGRAIQIADWDNDGVNDIVIGVPGDSPSVAVSISNGDGTFRPQEVLPVTGTIGDIVAADFTNDGRLDVATATGLVLRVFATRQDGSFVRGASQATDLVSFAILLAPDLNLDGLPDIVGIAAGAVEIHTATGIAAFGPSMSLPGGGSLNERGVDAGDLDGDGVPDLAVARSNGVLDFFKGNGDGTFQLPVGDVLPGTPSWITLGDVDGSGTLDAAVLIGSDVVLYTNDCQFAPTIAAQPASKTGFDGFAVTLKAGVGPGSTPLTYQWRRDGVPLADGPGVAGSATPTLTLDPVSFGDIGLYDLVVSNAFGSAVSDAAVLSVMPAPPACPGDYNGDGIADTTDVLDFLADAENACP